MRDYIAPDQRVVVIGAGFIGLEFAATARAKGLEVDVIELAPRVMARAVTAEISEHFQSRHTAAGIRIHLGVQVTSIESDGSKVTGVSLSDGRHIKADLIVVGVGVLPNVELAAEAGLKVAAGIVVDEYLLTSDPDISAIGDCALYESPRFGGSLRLESVQNATDQGRRVADALVDGSVGAAEVPWFWSTQGPLRLQIAGLGRPDDDAVVSGDVAGGRFSVFCFRDEQLVAVESLNRPADHLAARRVLASGAHPTPEQVTDPRFSLKDHAKQFAVAS